MRARQSPHQGSTGRFIGLRTKFVVFISLIIIAVCTGLSWYFIHQQAQLLTRTLTDTGLLLVNNLAHNSRYAAITEDLTDLEQFIDGVMEDDEVVYAVITETGRVASGGEEQGAFGRPDRFLRSQDSPLYPDESLARPFDVSQSPMVIRVSTGGGLIAEPSMTLRFRSLGARARHPTCLSNTPWSPVRATDQEM